MSEHSEISQEWRDARNILVIRLDNLGDVLLTTPAIHAIKTSLPDARITLLASPVGAQAGWLNPDLADVIVYEAPFIDPWRRLPHDSARAAHDCPAEGTRVRWGNHLYILPPERAAGGVPMLLGRYPAASDGLDRRPGFTADDSPQTSRTHAA